MWNRNRSRLLLLTPMGPLKALIELKVEVIDMAEVQMCRSWTYLLLWLGMPHL